jgi:protein-tyrosine phosphatase
LTGHVDVDFHNHLMPGVDDGARTLPDTRGPRSARGRGSRSRLRRRTNASLLAHDQPAFALRLAELDRVVGTAIERGGGRRQVWRGAEVALDVPGPDLSDERLRLAGTRFVLVEFAYMTVPPNSGRLLAGICADGWIPVLAHPERYARVRQRPGLPAAWREAGALLQVNGGSLLDRYGGEARQVACDLLAAGLADFPCSDYHARSGGSAGIPRCTRESRWGAGSTALQTNPQRMLRDELPLAVPPLARPASIWRRMSQLFR